MKVTNITAGPKGLHTKDGALVMLEPGQSGDLDVDAKEVNDEWFATGEKAAKEAAAAQPAQAADAA